MTDVAQLSIVVDASSVPRASQSMDQMAASGSKLESGIKTLIGVWATWELEKHLTDLALIGARYETLGVAMTQVGLNAGFTSSQMAGFQAQLQATGISAIESRNNLSRMAAAQLDLSKSAQLARVAQDAAVLGDINSSEAFERLVQGIVSGQPRILHTMGIFADFMGVEKKWADAHGETIESMSQEEKVTARFNATLEEGAKRAGVYEAAMGTAGKQIKSMERFIQDLEVQFGKTMGESLTYGVAKFATGLKDSNKAMEDWEKSGGQGVFAMKLRDDLASLTDTLIGTTAWMYKHRDAIVTMVGAYAGFKLGGIVAQTWAYCLAQEKVVASHIASAAAAYNESTATTKAALAKAGFTYTTQQSNLAQIAEAQTMLVHNSLALQSAVASGAMSEAEAVLVMREQAVIAAELEKAAAINGANSAMAAGETLVGGLSGGLTILIAALGAAVAAWFMFDQTTTSKSKDSAQFMDERIRSATERMEKIKRFWEGIGQGKSPDRAEGDSWSALDEPASRKGMEVIRDAQQELAKAEASFRDGLGRSQKGMSAEQILAFGKHDEDSSRLWELARRRVDAQNELNKALEHEQKLVEALNNEHAQSDYKERFLASESQKGKATKDGLGGTVPTEYAPTEYGREIQRLQEELTKLTVSERAAFEMKLKLMDNGAGGDVSNGMGLYDQITAKKTLEVENELLQKNLNLLFKKKEANESINPFKEYQAFSQRMDPLGADLARLKSDKATLDHLKPAMEAAGTYRRALENVRLSELRLKAESGDTWAIIGNQITGFADNASTALANFMNGTKTGFRDMVSSMLLDMEKMIIKQKLMQPLMNGLGAGIAGLGGDGGFWANFANGFGKPAANGGYRDGTQPYLVGERGPELFTPGQSGTITPNHALGGTSISAPITIVVQSDGQTSAKGGDGAQNMKALGQMMAAKCREVIVTESRSGGLLNPV